LIETCNLLGMKSLSPCSEENFGIHAWQSVRLMRYIHG